MLIDTHCHLNFKTFDGHTDEVVKRANEAGISHIVIPGTDYPTSKKAFDIAVRTKGAYAAAGIHPHHIFEMMEQKDSPALDDKIRQIEMLLKENKVVAVGEVGIDRHMYRKTKYPEYRIEEEFVNLQKSFLKAQMQLAISNKKSLILHNREAKEDFLEVLKNNWDARLEKKTVFHCCEADSDLLEFAKTHRIFIGVDGDVVYDKNKQEFIRQVPIEILVLETDSPFLAPNKKFPNEPKNIVLIAETIGIIKNITPVEVAEHTTHNAKSLFSLSD